MGSTDIITACRSACRWPGFRFSSGTGPARVAIALSFSLAAWLFLSAGRGSAADLPVTVALAVEVRLAGLPSLVYAGEPFNVSLHLVSRSASVLQLQVRGELGGQSISRALSLSPGDSADAVLPLRALATESECMGKIRVMEASSAQSILWEEPFALRDVRGDLSGLHVAEDRTMADRSVLRVVLVNTLEDDATYRRWAPVRWAGGLWRRHGMPHTVWGSARLLGPAGPNGSGDEGRDAVIRVPGITASLIPYDGHPLQAMLNVPASVPDGSRLVLCFLWGYEEAAAHLPVRELERTLDAAIDRVRARSPETQVVLATPPPFPCAERVTAAYAVAIRRLARAHHMRLIDLHAKVLSQKDWISLYALNGDRNVLGLYPSQEGCRKLAAWLEEGMP